MSPKWMFWPKPALQIEAHPLLQLDTGTMVPDKLSACQIDEDRILATYGPWRGAGYMRVLTINSDNTLTAGPQADLVTVASDELASSAMFDSTYGLVALRVRGTQRMHVYLVKIDGTTPSVLTSLDVAVGLQPTVCRLDDTRMLVMFAAINAGIGTNFFVVSRSGETITATTPVSLLGGEYQQRCRGLALLKTDEVVSIRGRDGGYPAYSDYITVTGTTLSFDTVQLDHVQYNAGGVARISDTSAAVFYRPYDGASFWGQFHQMNISGGNISVGVGNTEHSYRGGKIAAISGGRVLRVNFQQGPAASNAFFSVDTVGTTVEFGPTVAITALHTVAELVSISGDRVILLDVDENNNNSTVRLISVKY